jgi:glutamine synthetase
MTKYKLEYIWLDGYSPTPNLRGKTQIKTYDSFPSVEELPLWGFDGSSTKQAEGHSSDCVLEPVRVFPDAAQTACWCFAGDDAGWRHAACLQQARHHSRRRGPGSASSRNISSTNGRPLGFPIASGPQGPYYTGVGYRSIGSVARQIVEKHIDLCLDAGINIEGINAEVAKGQWEFQIFGKGSKKAADEMWMARYLMQRLTEKYGIDIEYHCKPLGDTDWNGSGMHANFSTTYMREVGGKDYFEKLMKAFELAREDHIAVYGPDNHKHETAAITDFTYGVADRALRSRAAGFVKNDCRGLSEDRPHSRGSLPDRFANLMTSTGAEEALKSVAA